MADPTIAVPQAPAARTNRNPSSSSSAVGVVNDNDGSKGSINTNYPQGSINGTGHNQAGVVVVSGQVSTGNDEQPVECCGASESDHPEDKQNGLNIATQFSPSNSQSPPPPPPPSASASSFPSPPLYSPYSLEVLVPWSHGQNQKVSVFQLQNWIALLLTLDGRDKVTKVLQYTCRLLSWWFLALSSSSATPEQTTRRKQQWLNHSRRFGELKAALTQGRKSFRFGRTFIELYRLVELLNAGSDLSTAAASLKRRVAGLLTTSSSPCREENSQPPSSTLSTLWIDKTFAAVKLLGLAGFWAADNVSYLAQSGLFDDYRNRSYEERMTRRKRLVSGCSSLANRSYFIGALAGLVVSYRAYVRHRSCTILPLLTATNRSDDDEGDKGTTDGCDQQLLNQALTKQFTNLVALVKSCCDVLVFSNNPGVDLWRKRHRNGSPPMHEGFHCLCGLLSASTVLYNNFPNSAVSKK